MGSDWSRLETEIITRHIHVLVAGKVEVHAVVVEQALQPLEVAAGRGVTAVAQDAGLGLMAGVMGRVEHLVSVKSW